MMSNQCRLTLVFAIIIFVIGSFSINTSVVFAWKFDVFQGVKREVSNTNAYFSGQSIKHHDSNLKSDFRCNDDGFTYDDDEANNSSNTDVFCIIPAYLKGYINDDVSLEWEGLYQKTVHFHVDDNEVYSMNIMLPEKLHFMYHGREYESLSPYGTGNNISPDLQAIRTRLNKNSYSNIKFAYQNNRNIDMLPVFWLQQYVIGHMLANAYVSSQVSVLRNHDIYPQDLQYSKSEYHDDMSVLREVLSFLVLPQDSIDVLFGSLNYSPKSVSISGKVLLGSDIWTLFSSSQGFAESVFNIEKGIIKQNFSCYFYNKTYYRSWTRLARFLKDSSCKNFKAINNKKSFPDGGNASVNPRAPSLKKMNLYFKFNSWFDSIRMNSNKTNYTKSYKPSFFRNLFKRG